MALITTTGSVIRQYNAFTGLSATERSQSGIARAEVTYYNVNDDWSGPGSGNNRLYQTGNISLPNDFGYVLTDAYLQISDPGAQRIYPEAVAQLRIYPGGVLGPQINTYLTSAPSRMDDSGTTAIGSIDVSKYNTIYPSIDGEDGVMVYSLASKPNAIIYPFGAGSYTTASNPASLFNFGVAEQTLNGADYKITLYLRFLQYDIDQSYNYVIQSPQLTR